MERGLKGDLVVNEPIDIEPIMPSSDGKYHPLHLDAEECGNLLSMIWFIIEDAITIKSTAKTIMESEDVQIGDKFHGHFRAAQSMAGRIERCAHFLYSAINDAQMSTLPESDPEPGPVRVQCGQITRDLCGLITTHMKGLDIDGQMALRDRIMIALED